MGRRWTQAEERHYRDELQKFYVAQNLSIKEVGVRLGISEKTVFDRLGRVGIPCTPSLKSGYLKKRQDIVVPRTYSPHLAEFFGIMLGDGHLSHFQIMVTLGNKEVEYVDYVVQLMSKIFHVAPRVSVRQTGYRTIYLGSVELSDWLSKQGLVYHKVKAQVDTPRWIEAKNEYMQSFVRGFFDTDGTVYKLKFGVQISFTNRSLPLLYSLHHILCRLQYRPSLISGYHIYLTRREEVARFFKEIQPQNKKHVERYKNICAGRPVGGGGRL